MRNSMCLTTAVVIALLWHSAVVAAPELQSGDRWPQNLARAVAVDAAGGHVFLGRGNILTVLDSNLGFIGSKDLGAEIMGIFYDADHVYAAMGQDGLQIVDVSVPAAPVVVADGFRPSNGPGIDSVFVSGNYAYAVSVNRFTAIDVSDPASPSEAGAVTIPGLLVYSINLFVSGNLAAVADQVNGLHLIDVSVPQAPVWESITSIAGAWDVRVSGNNAYVTASAGGLAIIDIADRSQPEILSTLAPAGANFLGLFVDGDTAWVADASHGVAEVNVADSASPVLVQTLTGTLGAYGVTLSGADLWVCDFEQGLQKIGTDNAQYNPPADAVDLFVDASLHVYMVDSGAGAGDQTEGLRILNGFTLGDSLFEGFVATPGQASAVFVSGNYAYVADGDEGLQIVDVADKSHPAIVGALDTPGTAQDVLVSGDYAYVADGAGGLRIIAITDNNDPQAAGAYDTDGTAHAVFVSGDYAYIADGAAGLKVIDITDKLNPILAGFIDTPGTANDLVVSGNYAYIADGTSGLQIINIASPAAPAIAGSYDTAGDAMGISLSGNYARLADGSNGLVTIDIATPAAPSLVAAWSNGTNGNALKVFSVDEYAFIAEGLAGAAVYKLSDEDPFVPEPYDPPSSGGSCFIEALADTN